MKFKICVVGCGNMAFHGHGPSYKKYSEIHPEVELTACCDLDENKAEHFKKEFGFLRHYSFMEEMLSQEKPQAVCLLVPEHLIAVMSVRILELGYPLLMEKPPGLNKEENLKIIEAGRSVKIPAYVAFNRRAMPLITEMKNLLERNKMINSATNIHYVMKRVARKDSDFATTAIHGIDIVRFIAGSDYKTIHFFYQELVECGKSVVNTFMDCTFHSGAHAQISFCPVSGFHSERMEVSAGGHTIFLEMPLEGAIDYPGRMVHYEKNELKLEKSGVAISESAEAFILNGFYHENETFFQSIRNCSDSEGNIKTSYQSVEVADCIRRRDQYFCQE